MTQKNIYRVFAVTIFFSSFLLFLIQPLISKYILPWFGGGAMIWTISLVFYQTFLLFGYIYAHFLSKLPKRHQLVIHMGLFLLSLLMLPIIPDKAILGNTSVNPSIMVMFILTTTIGLPYLLLSSSAPLLQSWYSRSQNARSPYTLYAISNFASLFALFMYPLFFEHLFSLSLQAYIWSFLFVVLLLLVGKSLLTYNTYGSQKKVLHKEQSDLLNPTVLQRFLWIFLSALGTTLLLAITAEITLNLPPTPFLWILPLSLYLLTFILAFGEIDIYKHDLFLLLFFVLMPYLIHPYDSTATGVVLHCATLLFTGCMICHNELIKLKPSNELLTSFYLSISLGGALGGIFVGIIAPLIFPANYELTIVLFFICILILMFSFKDPKSFTYYKKSKLRVFLISFAALLTFCALTFEGYYYTKQPVFIDRNFYGIVRITETEKEDPEQTKLRLLHGNTLHGYQFTLPEKQGIPTSYYSRQSGLGLTMNTFISADALRIGVIGLGVGTTAAYTDSNDVIRFYEIDERIKTIAEDYFWYLKNTEAAYEVVIGDARVSMQAEEPQQYDILVVDAFTSDAIPVHLLTTEAFYIYEQHIKPDGLILFHISNKYLDLEPVIAKLAEYYNFNTKVIHMLDTTDMAGLSDWILVTNNLGIIESDSFASLPAASTNGRHISLWTDDYSNLIQIVKMPRVFDILWLGQ